MDKEELTARLEAPVKSRMVDSLTAVIENNELNVDDLLDISFYKKKEIAFRAAWMLEYIMMHRPAQFSLYVSRFFELMPDQKNQSAMRHYTKMAALITDRRADPIYQQLVRNIDFEPIIDLLFSWLVDPDTMVAVKVHCMQALANLAPEHSWIKDELLETIDHLTGKTSIAFFARAKMVKKQLKRR